MTSRQNWLIIIIQYNTSLDNNRRQCKIHRLLLFTSTTVNSALLCLALLDYISLLMLDHPTYIFHTSWLHCLGISCSDFDPSGNLVRGTNIPGISFWGINIPIKAARQIGPNLGNLVQALLSSSRMFIGMFYWVCCMRTRSTYCTDEWKKDSAVPPNGKAAIHSPRESQWKPYSTCM